MGVDDYNVTNKEAAEILKALSKTLHIYTGRANGKTIMNYKIAMAFVKAIVLLENTPDR